MDKGKYGTSVGALRGTALVRTTTKN